MRFLNQFSKFDWQEFAKDKEFIVNGISEYKDYNTGGHLGTKVEVLIAKDDTVYKQPEGENQSNRYEKLILKVEKDINFPIGTAVIPKEVIASIFGEYRNQLSIKCTDVVMSESSSAKVKSNA